MAFFGNLFKIFGLVMILVDVGSDLMVGIDLYNSCHYKWAAISFFFTALPSLLVLVFVTVTCLLPSLSWKLADNMTIYVEEVSGLHRGDLIGLVLCFPLYTFYLAIRGPNFLDKKDLGEQTIQGILLLELLAESMPQFIFTCYVRAQLGPPAQG